MDGSVVVTGGARGVGRAIVERLADDGLAVAALDRDPAALAWTREHPARGRLIAVVGDATDPGVTDAAVDQVSALAPLRGWVNNAAVFRDAALHTSSPSEVITAITANIALMVTGATTAVRRFLADGGSGGAIVNVSSHQAQRAVRGALPYVTAKAAIEGLTRALAVDYGSAGIRTNAVALGSISTPRYEAYLAGLDPAAAQSVIAQMAQLHPLGRVGRGAEVAATVAFLLSDAASFVNGAVLPVDGGRAALGLDPESV